VSLAGRALLIAALLGSSTPFQPGRADDPQPAVRIVLIDGRAEEVACFEASGDSAIRLPDGRELACDDLRVIEPVRPPAVTAAGASEPSIEVRLAREEGRFRAVDAALSGEVCSVTRHGGAAWAFPLDDLRALKFDPAAEPDSFRAALARPPAERDLLFARLAGGVTAIDAYVESITAEAVAFEWMDEARTLPREKLYGVVFAAVAREAPPPPRFVVELADGGRLPGDSVNLESAGDAALGREVRVALSAATTIDVPWGEVRRIRVRSDRVRFLSDLSPESVLEKPIIALPRRWQADRSVTGSPLRAGTESFDKGLGMQSGTTLTYKLGGEWSDFAAVLALDPETGGGGDCVFIVRGDGHELLRQPLRGTDAPQPVRVAVVGVDRLELIVEYGGDLDFGDHANWCDTRLVRPAVATASAEPDVD
jgi:hypothetical protein